MPTILLNVKMMDGHYHPIALGRFLWLLLCWVATPGTKGFWWLCATLALWLAYRLSRWRAFRWAVWSMWFWAFWWTLST
jgi:hypothetical protein